MLFLFVFVAGLFAQDYNEEAAYVDRDSSQVLLKSLTLSLQTGFIFAHSEEVQNTEGANPVGLELYYSWQKNTRKNWDICGCIPQHSFNIAYYNYDTPILGSAIIVAYTLEPWYKIGRKSFLSFRAGGGLAYLTSPYDPVTNPGNQSYSSAISGYVSLGLGAWFFVSDRWALNPSLRYHHISNGGIKLPNKGINSPGVGLGIQYRLNPVELRSYQRRDVNWRDEPIRWDVGVFGTQKRILNSEGESEYHPVVGVAGQLAKRIGKINNLTGGLEINMDKAVEIHLEQQNLDGEPWAAGLLIGHEFILGKFLFSQRIGYYLYKPAPDFDRFYHRWGLAYRLGDHFSFGINLLAHRHVAYYTDFRVMYIL